MIYINVGANEVIQLHLYMYIKHSGSWNGNKPAKTFLQTHGTRVICVQVDSVPYIYTCTCSY